LALGCAKRLGSGYGGDLMAVFVVTGELGSGKTLMAISKIRDALQRGCKVATNIDLRLEHIVTGRKPRIVTRLPDWPRVHDFEALGKGHEGRFDEKKFGWIVLDEMATFLNARAWNEKESAGEKAGAGRLKMINWLRHARKARWHLLLLSQDLESLDKQVRAALAEHVVRCKRMDRFTLPFVSVVTKLVGLGAVTMPQIHMGVVRYGSSPNSPIVDRWWLPDAKSLHSAYDTEQKILGEIDGPSILLDARSAPYLWEPSGLYEFFWKCLPRLLPRSAARVAHEEFRLFEAAGFSSAKPAPVSYRDWLASATLPACVPGHRC